MKLSKLVVQTTKKRRDTLVLKERGDEPMAQTSKSYCNSNEGLVDTNETMMAEA